MYSCFIIYFQFYKKHISYYKIWQPSVATNNSASLYLTESSPFIENYSISVEPLTIKFMFNRDFLSSYFSKEISNLFKT